MSDNPCSVGALKKALTSGQPPMQVTPNPVLQVLQIKPIAAQANAPERFRVVLSDSVHFVQAMISTQSNYRFQSGEVTKGCFIRLTDYNAQKIKDTQKAKERGILIILDMEVLKQFGVRDKIGNPVGLENLQASTPAVAPQDGMSAGSFYGNKPAAAPSHPPAERGGGAGTSGTSRNTHPHIYPIDAISPYQNKWTVKVRVSYKSEIKHWSNQRNEGKLFTVTLSDETGEIRATGFNQECDSFYEVLQEGKVYYISKCRVVNAKKNFSVVKNDYELTFWRETEIEECNDDSFPKPNYNFVPIADLARVEKDAIVDVLGVVKEVGDVEDFTAKSQKSYSKREIVVVDNSEAQVRCTVWGNAAKSWEIGVDNIVILKSVKVSDFGGRSLSMTFGSSVTPNPDIDQAFTLKGWYDAQGQRDLKSFQSHVGLAPSMGGAIGRTDPVKTLAQVRDDVRPIDNEVSYFTTVATIVYIKHDNVSYPACTEDGCNKKVINYDDSWRCEKCNKSIAKPQYRYIMTISVNDAFGQAWFSCFDDVGRLIMGKTADELEELKEKSQLGEIDSQEYENCFTSALCKAYTFRCRAKKDTYNDQDRVRISIMSAAPLNYSAEITKLFERVKLYA